MLQWQGTEDFYDESEPYGWQESGWRFEAYTTNGGYTNRSEQGRNPADDDVSLLYSTSLYRFYQDEGGFDVDASGLSKLIVLIQDDLDAPPSSSAEYAITLNPADSYGDGTFTAQLTKGDDLLRLSEASNLTYSLFNN